MDFDIDRFDEAPTRAPTRAVGGGDLSTVETLLYAIADEAVKIRSLLERREERELDKVRSPERVTVTRGDGSPTCR